MCVIVVPFCMTTPMMTAIFFCLSFRPTNAITMYVNFFFSVRSFACNNIFLAHFNRPKFIVLNRLNLMGFVAELQFSPLADAHLLFNRQMTFGPGSAKMSIFFPLRFFDDKLPPQWQSTQKHDKFKWENDLNYPFFFRALFFQIIINNNVKCQKSICRRKKILTPNCISQCAIWPFFTEAFVCERKRKKTFNFAHKHIFSRIYKYLDLINCLYRSISQYLYIFVTLVQSKYLE